MRMERAVGNFSPLHVRSGGMDDSELVCHIAESPVPQGK